MKLILAFLLFPMAVFGQSVKNDYNDSLSNSNGPRIQDAIINYLLDSVGPRESYAEMHWHIFSVCNKYEDSPEGKEFESKAVPVMNNYQRYMDSVTNVKKAAKDSAMLEFLQFERLSDSLKKYKLLFIKHHEQYMDNREHYKGALRYYIVDFIFKKKSITAGDAEAYSFHITPDFHVRSAIHLRGKTY